MNIDFDDDNNLIVVDVLVQKNDLGVNVSNQTTRFISDEQLERHMPMFQTVMTVAEKTEAADIIAEVKSEAEGD